MKTLLRERPDHSERNEYPREILKRVWQNSSSRISFINAIKIFIARYGENRGVLD